MKSFYHTGHTGEKRRPFTATAKEKCELAVVSRVAYNRVLKKQLQVRALVLDAWSRAICQSS